MDVPTIQKIVLITPILNWNEILDQTAFSQRPVLFHFQNAQNAQDKTPSGEKYIVELIAQLEQYLIKKNISFYFPNPIFVLVDHPVHYTGQLSVYNDYQKIPKYFRFSQASFSSKERLLMKKVDLMNAKLRSLPIRSLMAQRANYATKQKTMYEKYKQMEFFKKLAWDLESMTKMKTK